MKKFLLIIFCIIFTGLNSGIASTYVQYNNAGAPISVSHGWHAPMSVRRAEAMYNNRPYRYGYARPAYPARPARPYNAYNALSGPYYRNSISTSAPVRSISRFDKNYRIKPTSSYVQNGVRYYN